jgi:hypothetical protein
VVQFVLFAGAFGAETGTGAITGASLMVVIAPGHLPQDVGVRILLISL